MGNGGGGGNKYFSTEKCTKFFPEQRHTIFRAESLHVYRWHLLGLDCLFTTTQTFAERSLATNVTAPRTKSSPPPSPSSPIQVKSSPLPSLSALGLFPGESASRYIARRQRVWVAGCLITELDTSHADTKLELSP